MTDLMWSLIPFVGIGMVGLANVLRAQRTENINCLGHFFVSAQDMTTTELILNRGGIAVFVAGILLNLFWF